MKLQPLPSTGLTLLIGPRAQQTAVLHLIHRIALTQPLTVIDGLRGFDAFAIARALRRETVALDRALGQIGVARAGTAYQLVTLLEQMPACQPLIIHNLLAPFCDPSLRLESAHRLMRQLVQRLALLKQRFPIIGSLAVPPASHAGLLGQLREIADRTLLPHAPETAVQPHLL